MTKPNPDNVRRYWKRRVAKLEAQLKAAKALADAHFLAVTSDPAVPKGTIFFIQGPPTPGAASIAGVP